MSRDGDGDGAAADTPDRAADPPAFRADLADGVCRFSRSAGAARFLSTGFDGGRCVADAAYNVTVPDGWGEAGPRDLGAYVADRVAAAALDGESGAAGAAAAAGTTGTAATAADRDPPALLTGVDQRHARIARLDGATVLATAGVSNPAALPVNGGWTGSDGGDNDGGGAAHAGTVNVVVGTTRALPSGALANLLTVAAEAKAATLLALTGVPGTTTDAVVAACDPDGDPTRFSGSATDVGGAARACVRDALVAGLASRYGDEGIDAAADARAGAGVVTDDRAATSPLTPDH